MASAPNVLALFGPTPLKSCLIAVSNSIYKVEYRERLSMDEIGAEIDCSGGTIENAKYQRNLLGFDKVARLLARWPEHTQEIRNLWEMQPVEPETNAEKRRRLLRELSALEDSE
jgi:hypothetical protein